MFLSLNDRNVLNVARIDFRRSAPMNLKWDAKRGKFFNRQAMRFVGRDANTGEYRCNGRNECEFATVEADTEPEVWAINEERIKLEAHAKMNAVEAPSVVLEIDCFHGFYIA